MRSTPPVPHLLCEEWKDQGMWWMPHQYWVAHSAKHWAMAHCYSLQFHPPTLFSVTPKWHSVSEEISTRKKDGDGECLTCLVFDLNLIRMTGRDYTTGFSLSGLCPTLTTDSRTALVLRPSWMQMGFFMVSTPKRTKILHWSGAFFYGLLWSILFLLSAGICWISFIFTAKRCCEILINTIIFQLQSIWRLSRKPTNEM